MQITKIAPVALLSAAALLFSGCAANEAPAGATSSTQTSTSQTSNGSGALSGTLAGQGSSAMDVAVKAWAAGFQQSNSGVTINYNPTGSGAGKKAFMGGGSDWAGSDEALKAEELTSTFAKCAPGTGALDLPLYISPIAVILNVQGVDKLNLNADVTAKIFAGKITKWNDAALAAINPGVTLPDAAIKPVHRSDDSGTTANFTDYLAKAAEASWGKKGSKTWPTDYAGEAAKGNAGVVAAVKGGQGTIGYADESQAKGMTIAAIGEGTYALPTAADAAKVVEASPLAKDRPANDLAIAIDRKAPGYPIVLVGYGIVCQQYADAATAAKVKGFLGYAASAEGQKAAVATAGNAPLSAALSEKVAAAIATIK